MTLIGLRKASGKIYREDQTDERSWVAVDGSQRAIGSNDFVAVDFNPPMKWYW
jgi:hypothetical protein